MPVATISTKGLAPVNTMPYFIIRNSAIRVFELCNIEENSYAVIEVSVSGTYGNFKISIFGLGRHSSHNQQLDVYRYDLAGHIEAFMSANKFYAKAGEYESLNVRVVQLSGTIHFSNTIVAEDGLVPIE